MSDAGRKPPRMTVEEFTAWSQMQAGRHELYDGEVVTMQAEREAHTIVKLSVAIALRDALKGGGAGCRAFTDGRSIRIDAETSFEPDAVIDCGPRDPESLFARIPVVVVEITSPSTSRIDRARKLVGYFRVPSVCHYLIVDAESRLVIHFRREGTQVSTRFLPAKDATEPLMLDPPGIAVRIADFFTDLDAEE